MEGKVCIPHVTLTLTNIQRCDTTEVLFKQHSEICVTQWLHFIKQNYPNVFFIKFTTTSRIVWDSGSDLIIHLAIKLRMGPKA